MNLNKTKSSCDSCGSAQAKISEAIELSSSIPKGIYKEFSAGAKSLGHRDRIPTNGSIELTENCNFRCVHCYQGMNKAKQKLSGDKWCAIIDELVEQGTLWLLVTGGEPLLHPEFERIYTHAHLSGMLVTVFTNGRLIKDHHIELFKKYPPFAVEITLYGASEETYQKNTGSKNSFAIVRENIKKIKDAGIVLKLKSVAFKGLAEDIPELKRFAEKDMGLEFRFDTKLDPGIYGDSFESLRLSPEETVALEDAVVGADRLIPDLNHFKSLGQKLLKNPEAQQMLYTCGAGKTGFYIDYKGFVHTCSTGRLEKEAFDLNQKTFAEIWQLEMPKVVYQKRRELNAVCVSCEYRTMCDACPATAKLATGSKEGRPMYICQLTMARKKRFFEEEGIIKNGSAKEKEKICEA